MRVLWVKGDKLLPLYGGGNIRSYNILRQLALRHEVTLLSYYSDVRDDAYDQELQSALPGTVCVATRGNNSSLFRRRMNYLTSLPGEVPYAVHRLSSMQVRDRVKAWSDERRFDVAVCDFLVAAECFPRNLTFPAVLFQHNVESEIYRRQAAIESNPVLRLLYRVELAKMLRYERSAMERFDHTIAVSDHDRRLLGDWTDPRRISVVPTGVDLRRYKPEPAAGEQEPLIAYVGSMGSKPNEDAVEYFCREIWPRVRAEVGNARFRIVGKNPSRRVRALASDSVEITGTVAAVEDHLREAAVAVVPLRIGGGTRLKIYEAMAMGKAVVSTSVGAEGLDVHNGQDLLLRDDAASFAEAVIQLLRDGALRGRYQRAAALSVTKYDWPIIGEKFSRVLELVAAMDVPSVARLAPAANL